MSTVRHPLASPLLALSSLTGLPRKVRWALLRMSGVKTEAWNIAPRCYFGTNNVVIGRGTFVNRGCVFDGMSQIRIGERCALGMEVMLVTSTHPIGSHERRAGDVESLPLIVGDGCWIGARATILPGVTVGAGAVIAAGAVVVSDCDPDTVYAGVPARAVRSLG
jgi:maltose O-acetyltransferase